MRFDWKVSFPGQVVSFKIDETHIGLRQFQIILFLNGFRQPTLSISSGRQANFFEQNKTKHSLRFVMSLSAPDWLDYICYAIENCYALKKQEMSEFGGYKPYQERIDKVSERIGILEKIELIFLSFMKIKQKKTWKRIMSTSASLALGGISIGVWLLQTSATASSFRTLKSPTPTALVDRREGVELLPTNELAQTAQTIVVGLDALAIPAGYMSGADPSELIGISNGKPCPTGAECIKVTYTPGGVWGGIVWWPSSCGESGTPDAWNRARAGEPPCAINVLRSHNFSQVQRLTFWAKGERGDEVIEFKVGATDLWPNPGHSSGKITLTTEWEQYEIQLRGVDMSVVTAPFVWVAADLDNPEGAVFYLDDIWFEGLAASPND